MATQGTAKRRVGGAAQASKPKNNVSRTAVRSLARVEVRQSTAKHMDAPPKVPRAPRGIHLRRVLPLIREGKESKTHSGSTRVLFHERAAARAAVAPLAAPAEVSLLLATPLTLPAQQQVASNVDEPSVAMANNVVFYTGNWYAAFSTDGGTTFTYIDPTSMAQPDDGPGVEFCCDQVVQYIPQTDQFVWLMQYGPETGDNLQRLAFKKRKDVGNAQKHWTIIDITTEAIGAQGAFLDFPDLAVGQNCLYMTTNVFWPDKVGSAVVRLPLAGLDNGGAGAKVYLDDQFQSFRVAQNCGKTAYFAAHRDTSTLSVFSWDESQAEPAPAKDVEVARWIGGNGYRSRTPDGARWLDRADPRLTGATLAGNSVWFAWSVDQPSNQRPNPFVQVARIDVTTMTVENINVYDPDSATAYGALSTNADGEVGISYMIGGGNRYPSHAVGILTDPRTADAIVATGTRSPLPSPGTGKYEWGDFLTVRRAYPDGKSFAATGYTLQGPGPGSNRDATPVFVLFARGAAGTSIGPGPTPGPIGGNNGDTSSTTTTTPTSTGPGPITDVNALPAVSAATAVAIKQACRAAGAQPQAAVAAMPAPVTAPRLVTKPGTERWPVKTGNDQDVATVGKNVIGGHDYGRGIVDATVEELTKFGRPAQVANVSGDNKAFTSKRVMPLEMVIFRIQVTITDMKLEADGDYHLVLKGASGDTMIGEIPTPTKEFITNSPWLDNIAAARKQIDDKFVSKLSPADFAPSEDGILVPRASFGGSEMIAPQLQQMSLPRSFIAPSGKEDTVPLFKTQVPPTMARITGVGFFDRVHNQLGVCPFNGIELHPVLKIEWL